jgi:hypothetical protein
MPVDDGAKADKATSARFIYSAGPPWMLDFLMPVVLGLATLGQGAVILLDVMRSSPVWFDVTLLALLLVLGYWSLWRIAYRLEYADGLLICRGRFSSWSFPLSQVARLRPAAVDIGLEVVETRSHPRRVLACVSKGFGPFAKALEREHPEIEVRIGWVSRLVERMPWPSSFREF